MTVGTDSLFAGVANRSESYVVRSLPENDLSLYSECVRDANIIEVGSYINDYFYRFIKSVITRCCNDHTEV